MLNHLSTSWLPATRAQVCGGVTTCSFGAFAIFPNVRRRLTEPSPKCSIEIGQIAEPHAERDGRDGAIVEPSIDQGGVRVREASRKHELRKRHAGRFEELVNVTSTDSMSCGDGADGQRRIARVSGDVGFQRPKERRAPTAAVRELP